MRRGEFKKANVLTNRYRYQNRALALDMKVDIIYSTGLSGKAISLTLTGPCEENLGTYSEAIKSMDTLDCSTITLGNRAFLIAKVQLPCIASQPCKITKTVDYGCQQVYEVKYS